MLHVFSRRSQRHRRPRNPGAPRGLPTALLAALLLVLGLLATGGSPAAAAPACAGETNLFKGVCYTTASGAQHWLGTITAVNGKQFICVDFGKDSRLGGYTKRSVKGASNQFGAPVGDVELRALSYAYAAYTSGGSSGSRTTDAALSLVAREVFADSPLFPRITIGDQVKDAGFGAGRAVLSRARQIWLDASRHFGPYVVQVQGMPATLSVGDTFDLRVHVQSSEASGSRPMSGYAVHDTVSGFTINAGDGATTDAQGDVVVNLTYRGPGAGSFSAEAVGLPGTYANLAVPDDHGQQRGLIETAATVTAQASVSTGVTTVPAPQVSTVTSAARVTAGAPITDTVRVSGSPSSYAVTVTATLFGPYAAQPGAADCTAEKAAGSVTFAVAGDGDHRTPPVATNGPGYYVWQESLPADAGSGAPAVQTPCGVTEETTLALAAPVLATQASTQTARVGDAVTDTVTMTGAAPGSTVAGDYQLLGPVPPAADGSCEGLDWTGAGVLGHGSFTITAGADGTGTATTAAETVTAAGCFTFVERGDATPTSGEIDWTPPGVAAETVLVKHQPGFVTRIHAQSSQRGEVVFDLVTVSGTGGAVVAAQWKLLGLPEPAQGGCGAIPLEQWAHATTIAQGTFEARGDGTVATGKVAMTRTRCVTYVEHGDATATTFEVGWTAPGIPAETALVHADRPAVVPYVQVPAGIAGGAAASGRPPGHALRGVLPALVTAAGLGGLVAIARAVRWRRRGGHRG